MNVRLIQLDGALPNLALMKLAHWHKANGDDVLVTRHIYAGLFDPQPDRVYGSSIFAFSDVARKAFHEQWPDGLLGGTGSGNWQTVEEVISRDSYEHYDYSGYPEFQASIGFTQRGCRLSCKFCVVPKKEGKPKSINAVHDIWRGEPYPRHLHILDNDFFGQPEWKERLTEIREGKFKACLSQGINVRMITDESAEALSSIDYRAGNFTDKRIYTAWDNLRDESVFFAGMDRLQKAGIPSTHVMAYMLIGYDKSETWERIWYRFKRMDERGIKPYPMVYDRSRKDLLCFQRYVIMHLYNRVGWPDYISGSKTPESVEAWRQVYEQDGPSAAPKQRNDARLDLPIGDLINVSNPLS